MKIYCLVVMPIRDFIIIWQTCEFWHGFKNIVHNIVPENYLLNFGTGKHLIESVLVRNFFGKNTTKSHELTVGPNGMSTLT